ncbi:MAG: long-chain fatty acid--CoA ligase [Candidatus Omnitrophota bacterium]|nr:MAG: long-chain fatty acid--CoA ligase [Candidatus Omnitrophota bacterium]
MRGDIGNLVQMLDDVADKYPEKIALVFGARKITYSHLVSSSKRIAHKLYELGVGEFDRVALWLPNCPEFVCAFFAILRVKAIVVPINTMFKREEAVFIVGDAGAKVLVCSIDKVYDSENMLSRIDLLKHVISLPAPRADTIVSDFSKFVKHSCEFERKVNIEADDLAQIIYTSGTTGRPKGACLSHRNLISNVRDCSKVINASRKDCFICVLPLFHSFASTVCMLLPLANGGKVVIMRAVRPFKRVIRAIFKHKVTVFAGVPSFYSILSEAKFSRWKILLGIFLNPVRLCISGAAALPLNVCQKFESRFRRPLLQGYGLTEASPVVSLNPLKGKRKPASIGRPLPSVQVKVVGKKGEELKYGEVGELLVKGPNVMKGYYNHSQQQMQKVLCDGWLYTGDLAKIDKDGFIYIMGRLKDMINVRGLNVYPREVEDVLYRHHRVREAAVVGVTHRHRGEVPVAFVVKEALLQERELSRYLRGNLASYKVPLKILFREALPKNLTGKILKRELQREVENIFK